uniref:Uncharacterized protein n=1 Tax=Rhizophora mucronata TaxID=61149 RepID=A0A2P2PU14_RHIMU
MATDTQHKLVKISSLSKM